MSVRPEVLLVEGEPVAGVELPRHVVPAPLGTRRILASDQASLRASLDGPVVAVVVDGRADAVRAAEAIAAVRALPGGAELPIVALAPAADALREAAADDPRLDVVGPPHAVASIHARLLLLAGASARAMPPERLRSA